MGWKLFATFLMAVWKWTAVQDKVLEMVMTPCCGDDEFAVKGNHFDNDHNSQHSWSSVLFQLLFWNRHSHGFHWLVIIFILCKPAELGCSRMDVRTISLFNEQVVLPCARLSWQLQDASHWFQLTRSVFHHETFLLEGMFRVVFNKKNEPSSDTRFNEKEIFLKKTCIHPKQNRDSKGYGCPTLITILSKCLRGNQGD